MKASYKWLKEFVDFSIPPRELAHALTMSGFEVEAIEETGDDVILDIAITPNRPDCLSIKGIAREISGMLGIPFKDALTAIRDPQGNGPQVEIEDPELCFRYASRLVLNVKPGPSPEWMTRRLESSGIRSTSNIVDITNYVLLETGQPLHAFDLDSLSGGKIVVKQAGDIKKFHTLDNEERTLKSDSLLIWDAEKPVAIAGVMGGLNTEVSDRTVNILLESAYFYPASVRRTSKFLNLSTEASYRFERGIDLNGVTAALDRAAQLIAEIAGGKVSNITDICPRPYTDRKIRVTLERINSLIGAEIDESFVYRILSSLGCEIKKEGQGMTVIPPSFRNDIGRDIDIIEEIARLYGYDRIPSTMPVIQMSPAPEHKTQKLIKSIKNSMVKSGFLEVINYSFINPEALDKLNISATDRRRELIFIRNPLRAEESAMRTTIIPALLNNISLNLNHGEKSLRLFEAARVFLSSGQKLPDEIIQMAAAYHKYTDRSLWKDDHDGFYDLKGVIENIFSELKIQDISFEQEMSQSEPYLHPGKSCSIKINGEMVGSMGTLHPEVTEAFNIQGTVTILEIYNIKAVEKHIPDKTNYVPLPKFPYVTRDIAIVVSKDLSVADVEKTIWDGNSGLIECVTIFDIYTGKPIPSDKKSLAFSVRYRDPNKTLTDIQVDALHSQIIRKLQDNLNAELR